METISGADSISIDAVMHIQSFNSFEIFKDLPVDDLFQFKNVSENVIKDLISALTGCSSAEERRPYVHACLNLVSIALHIACSLTAMNIVLAIIFV